MENISNKYEPPESKTTPEDPFRITRADDFTSETLLSALELGSHPQARAPHIPFMKPYVLSNPDGETDEDKQLNSEQLAQLISFMPSIQYFFKIPTPSLRRCCFLECETVFQVRAIQQMYTLKAITLLLINDINQRVAKVKEEKFKTIQQINDKVN